MSSTTTKNVPSHPRWRSDPVGALTRFKLLIRRNLPGSFTVDASVRIAYWQSVQIRLMSKDSCTSGTRAGEITMRLVFLLFGAVVQLERGLDEARLAGSTSSRRLCLCAFGHL